MKTTGIHTFRSLSDDGFRLWVNGTLLIDDWKDHGARYDSAKISLTAGVPATIKVEYYENHGLSVARLFLREPGSPKASAISTQRLTPPTS